MTPQELREVFEATFADFVAQLDAIDAQDKANREDPSKKGTAGHWADLGGGALAALKLMEVVDKWPDTPDASLHARIVEFAQVAAHALALYEEKEHRCAFLGRTYTETGVVAAHQHASEILGLEQSRGLLRMIHASPKLLTLFDHLKPERFKVHMELVVSAFPTHAATALWRPNEDDILTEILPIVRP